MTDVGRIIAIAVMTLGVGFAAIITAAAAERFLSASRDVHEEERRVADELAAIRERLEHLER